MRIVFILLVVTCGIVEMWSSNLTNIIPHLHRCSRHDYPLEKCIKRSIESMKPYLKYGISNFNIETFEPYNLMFHKLTLRNKYKGNVLFINIKVHGLTDYIIKKVRSNIDANHFNFVALFPFIYITAYFNIDSMNLTLPMKPGGYKLNASFTNIQANITMSGQYYEHLITEEEYFRLKKVVVQLIEVNVLHVNLEDLESITSLKDFTLFSDIWNTIEEEISRIIPLTTSNVIYYYASKIYNSFPTKMLFPR